MKKLIYLLLAILIITLPNLVVGQDTTTVTTDVRSWLSGKAMLVVSLLYAVYEVAVRFFPTVQNISLLSWVMKIIEIILPNNKLGGGTHSV